MGAEWLKALATGLLLCVFAELIRVTILFEAPADPDVPENPPVIFEIDGFPEPIDRFQNAFWDDRYRLLSEERQLMDLNEEILRLMYEVDAEEPSETRMLDLLAQCTTSAYGETFFYEYSERFRDHRREFVEYQWIGSENETLRNSWGEFEEIRNVISKVKIRQDEVPYELELKCVYKMAASDNVLPYLLDQVIYVE